MKEIDRKHKRNMKRLVSCSFVSTTMVFLLLSIPVHAVETEISVENIEITKSSEKNIQLNNEDVNGEDMITEEPRDDSEEVNQEIEDNNDIESLGKKENTEITIQEIKSFEDIKVDFGTTEEELKEKLPKKATIIDSVHNEHQVEVIWLIEDYKFNEIAEYTFIGSYDLPENIVGEKKEIKIRVIVKEQEKQKQQEEIEFGSTDFRKLIVMCLNKEEYRVPNAQWENKDVEKYIPTKDDMEKLRKLDSLEGVLDLELDNLSSLKGIEYAMNLEEINMLFANLDDISSLEKLSKLKYVCITNCKIKDISSLKNLTGIQYLILSSNNIKDISPLEKMVDLVELWLDGNEIVDISPLSNLTKLEKLNIYQNKIEDISVLKNLTNLLDLNLDENKIVNVSSLASLYNLVELNISENDIEDISAFKELKDLKRLYVIGNNIEDLSPLANLINLEKLSIRNNRIKDIEPLKELVDLNYLHIYENQIEDISAIKDMKKLEEFNFSKNIVKDLSPISGFEKLNVLFGYQNKVEDPSPVTTLTNCNVVNLSENSIVDISTLEEYVNGERHVIVDKQHRTIKVKDVEVEKYGNNIILTIKNPIRDLSRKYGRIDVIKEDGTTIKSDTEKLDNDILKITTSKNNFNLKKQNVITLNFSYKEILKAKVWDTREDGSLKEGYDFSGKINFILAPLGNKTNTVEPKNPNKNENVDKDDKPEKPSENYDTDRDNKSEKTNKQEKRDKNDKVEKSNKIIELGELKREETLIKNVKFIDLNKVPWAREAIENLAIKKIMIGRGSDEFKPNDKLTRAEFATILVRAFNLESVAKDMEFKDIKPNDWYYQSVLNLASMDIISGDGKGNFNPNGNITREQMIKMLMEVIKIKYPEYLDTKVDLTKFKDGLEVSNWAIGYIEQAIGLGLINGLEDSTINPKGDTSRAEGAVVIYKALNLIK